MSDGIIYEQRDIVLIPFPYSDLTGAKKRPALIISNSQINKGEDRICCLITSKNQHEGLVLSKKNLSGGDLPFQSWVKPQRLFTISAKIMNKKLGKVTKEYHDHIVALVNTFVAKE